MQMLIDSGAMLSVIKHSEAHKLQNKLSKPIILEDFSTNLVTANGSEIQVHGKILANITLPELNRTFDHTFVVAELNETSNYEGIIGYDFLKKHGLTLDTRNDHIMKLPKDKSSKIHSIKTKHSIELPPRQRILLNISFLPENLKSDTYILEGSASLPPDVFVARSISQNTQPIFIMIMNTSENSITIDKNQELATAEDINLEDIPDQTSFHDSTRKSKHALTNLTSKSKEKNPDRKKSYTSTIQRQDFDLSHLTQIQQNTLWHIISQHLEAFSSGIRDLGCYQKEQMKIHSNATKPISQRPYRLEQSNQKILKNQLTDLLEAGIIEERPSPWAAPTILVKKKDGTWRTVQDFRLLNATIETPKQPLPAIRETLDNLNGANWFSTLDLQSMFYNFEIHPQDREKTGFVTPFSQYCFLRVPMGLCSSPAFCERQMKIILSGLTGSCVYSFLDDLCIFSKGSFESHVEKIELVIKRIKQNGLKLKPSKCFFALKSIVFFGHQISQGNIQPTKQKITAVEEFPRPKKYHKFKTISWTLWFLSNFYSIICDNSTSVASIIKKRPYLEMDRRRRNSFYESKKSIDF